MTVKICKLSFSLTNKQTLRLIIMETNKQHISVPYPLPYSQNTKPKPNTPKTHHSHTRKDTTECSSRCNLLKQQHTAGNSSRQQTT